MNLITSALVLYLINALWQMPLVFATAWIASRFARPLGPHAGHRIWVAALFAEIIMPAFHLDSIALSRFLAAMRAAFSWPWNRHIADSEIRIITGPATLFSGDGLHPSPALIASSLIVWLGIALYFIARLAWRMQMTRTMRRTLLQLTPELQIKVNACLSALNAGVQSLSVAISAHVSGPATVGIRQPLLLFPPGFLDTVSKRDLAAVLAHELAHMQRLDYTKNLLYEIVSLPASFHPVIWMTLSRITGSREMLCDELAASRLGHLHGRQAYARSLLNLASTLYKHRQSSTIHAIGIFDANIFERRIMHLTRKPLALPRAQRIAIAACCSILALATASSALAFHINAIASGRDQAAPSRLKVESDKLTIVSKVQPIYPVEEKKKGTTGTVALAAIIGKDGQVENLRVKSSPSEGLSRSALDAVHQWRYQPYLLNGDPVEVETTINIIYSLGK